MDPQPLQADAMVMFSSAIRAGLSLAQALEVLAQECPRPINEEFAQIIGEYNLGKPLERTLNEAKERLRSENFVLFAAAACCVAVLRAEEEKK